MSDNTKIEWADATLNYANGCSLASPGCTNCYAMKQAHRFDVRRGLTVQSKGGMVWTGEVRLNEKALHQALAWKRGRKIFWNAHGDLFHENVPDEAIDRLFAVCALTPQHTHMILTKRSARMREYMNRLDTLCCDSEDGIWPMVRHVAEEFGADDRTMPDQWPFKHIWLGVSVEDQQRADERIPDLLATPAVVRFISAEPLLGPVDLSGICDGWSFWGPLSGRRWHDGDGEGPAYSEPCPRLDWVIIGTESGHKARHMDNAWAQVIVDQCKAAGVAVFVKQLSSGGARPLHDIEQFPEGLRVREFPAIALAKGTDDE